MSEKGPLARCWLLRWLLDAHGFTAGTNANFTHGKNPCVRASVKYTSSRSYLQFFAFEWSLSAADY